MGGAFVFGEGYTRGIMFIGEGPGIAEEEQGRPFVGRSGKVLRNVIAKLGLDTWYITNTVTCRSCSQAYTNEGRPVFYTNRQTGDQIPRIKDVPPTPLHITTCLPRLQNEIHLVDPVLIIALGLESAKTLSVDRVTAIRSERGKPREAHIPGAWSLPSKTTVRNVWERRVKGQIIRPTVPNMIRYLVIPTYHPAYLLRFHGDKSPGNPTEMFVKDMKLAMTIYDRYMLEVHSVIPSERDVSVDDILEEG